MTIFAYAVAAFVLAPLLTRQIAILWPSCPDGEGPIECAVYHKSKPAGHRTPQIKPQTALFGSLAALAWPITCALALVLWASRIKPLPLTTEQRSVLIAALEKELSR
ncbi:hypothetical protein [uncultured Arthrobacter sp.]|uniref:hypothetical protein n=1 Tax=uncultured Arthrobacter sp. TaxID=114050 RepID=UPI0025DDE8E3|nr:hypothetical protein [uncultured Arthrobacter sp.]